jgi:hypothetical protein
MVMAAGRTKSNACHNRQRLAAVLKPQQGIVMRQALIVTACILLSGCSDVEQDVAACEVKTMDRCNSGNAVAKLRVRPRIRD